MKHRHLILLPLALLTLASTILVAPESFKYSGSASDLKSDKFYYTEEHEEVKLNGVHLQTKIEYKNASGGVIVKKTIDYSKGKTNPSFIQEDLRDGCEEGAEVNGNKVTVIFRKNNKESRKTKNIVVPEPMVVDGGFNYFIKNNWESLVKGKEVDFNFVVPSQLDYVGFTVKKEKDISFNNKKAIVYKMEAANIIIRSLLSPIYITYDAQSRRLMKYEGISNISDAKGKSYTVKILYPTVGP